MIIAVGNAPSSGSTLLADLLDSLPFGVCGPEIRLFSVIDYFTRYESVRYQGIIDAPSSSCYIARTKFAISRLHCYGLTNDMLRDFLKQEDTFDKFCRRIAKYFAVLRGKEVKMFFEKTPENIQNAKYFLDTFPDSVFLHIVRNPLHVYKSLLNRGFPPYIAAITWLIDEAAVYHLREDPRLFTIRYEDLIQSPYRTIASFLETFNMRIDMENLKRSYENNEYRRLYSRKLSTWKVREYGRVRNANIGRITKSDIAALRYMYSVKVHPGYARVFGLSEPSFAGIASHYNYNFDNLSTEQARMPQWPDRISRNRLTRKWYADFRNGDASVCNIRDYLTPTEFVSACRGD